MAFFLDGDVQLGRCNCAQIHVSYWRSGSAFLSYIVNLAFWRSKKAKIIYVLKLYSFRLLILKMMT